MVSHFYLTQNVSNYGLYDTLLFSQYITKEIIKLYKEQNDEDKDKVIRITPHYFRHAFAIISRLNKVDVYDISRSLGHNNIQTTGGMNRAIFKYFWIANIKKT